MLLVLSTKCNSDNLPKYGVGGTPLDPRKRQEGSTLRSCHGLLEQLASIGVSLDCEFEYCTATRAQNTETRFFLPLKIGNKTFSALVDCGSIFTYFGKSKFSSVPEISRNSTPSTVQMADGPVSATKGQVSLDIAIGFVTHSTEARLLPCLAYDCVLGMNFLKDFPVEIEFKENAWTLRGIISSVLSTEEPTQSSEPGTPGVSPAEESSQF